MRISNLVAGSTLKECNLGHYDALFKRLAKKPIPSWKGIELLFEDYDLFSIEDQV